MKIGIPPHSNHPEACNAAQELTLEKRGVILPLGPKGAWDAGMVESPVIWFDTQAQRFAMVYTGYARVREDIRGYKAVAKPQVGLAWSDDLLHWEKDPRNPIFGPSGIPGSSDEAGTPGPFVIEAQGKYFLFYFGTTRKGYEKGTKAMNVATSTDLVTWKRYEGNPIISPSGTGWRKDAIWHPNVIRHDSTYYLFFNASGVVKGHEEEYIGYAVSTDLLHWDVRDAESPLLVGSMKPGAWDASGRTGDPSVFFTGGRWFMAYYSWDRKNAQDGIAWTTPEEFPLGWRTVPQNPILRIGPPGSFDAVHAAKPFVVLHNGTYHHFYASVADDERREIALATAPLEAIESRLPKRIW
ncbi:MAG: family 43 glycosylhydrolase [Ignavibacteriae bacterium]|nr:family 43 glycosylhydrolase [Ignavibacteriota bacterium]